MENTLLEGSRGGLQMVAPVIAVLAFTLLSFQIVFTSRKSAASVLSKSDRLPPGPKGWPVFGSLLSLTSLPHQYFARIANQYGPVMFFRMGRVRTLVVCSAAAAKEILKTNDHIWASRPEQIISSYITYGQRDVGFAPHGPYWRQTRKICALELFSPFRTNEFKGLRQMEISAALESVLERSKEGSALSVQEIVANMTTNIITQMMWNKRHFHSLGESSAEASEFRDIVTEIFTLLGSFNIADYIPTLRPITMYLQGYEKRMQKAHQNFDRFVDKVIAERRALWSTVDGTDGKVEDFVDLLLKPSKEAESDRVGTLPLITVKAILLDMVMAGTETSSTAIEWALAELVDHPTVMKKLQDEMDSVVGQNRLVSEADLPNLPYLQAVIKETFRMHPPGPLLIPHKSAEDSEISGYFIPGGTIAYVNVWAIQRDSSSWERPMQFDPDRFLDSTIDVKGCDYELLPFGSGRRMCPAVRSGVLVVQLTVGRMMQAFSWAVDGPSGSKLDMSERFGLSCPKSIPLTLLAKPRLPASVIAGNVTGDL